MFLISPILYKREGLGKVGLIADFNPFYRVLAPVRSGVIEGTVQLGVELITLGLNVILVILVVIWLKRIRYRLPLWV